MLNILLSSSPFKKCETDKKCDTHTRALRQVLVLTVLRPSHPSWGWTGAVSSHLDVYLGSSLGQSRPAPHSNQMTCRSGHPVSTVRLPLMTTIWLADKSRPTPKQTCTIWTCWQHRYVHAYWLSQLAGWVTLLFGIGIYLPGRGYLPSFGLVNRGICVCKRLARGCCISACLRRAVIVCVCMC